MMKKVMIYFDQLTDQEFLDFIKENSNLLDYFSNEVIIRWKKVLSEYCPNGFDKEKFAGYIPEGKSNFQLFGYLGGTQDGFTD